LRWNEPAATSVTQGAAKLAADPATRSALGESSPGPAIRFHSLSNGNISLMADQARRNGFPRAAILASEIVGDFKPQPRVYLAACEAFDLAPDDGIAIAAIPTICRMPSCELRVRTSALCRSVFGRLRYPMLA
jgi:2-haloacid dehalogenase